MPRKQLILSRLISRRALWLNAKNKTNYNTKVTLDTEWQAQMIQTVNAEPLKHGQGSIGIGKIMCRLREKWKRMMRWWVVTILNLLNQLPKESTVNAIIIASNRIRSVQVIYYLICRHITKIKAIKRLLQEVDRQISHKRLSNQHDHAQSNQCNKKKVRRLMPRWNLILMLSRFHLQWIITKDLIMV